MVLADNNVPAPDPLKSPFNGTPDAAAGAGGGAEAVASCWRPIAESTIAATTDTNTAVLITHIRTRRRWTSPVRGSVSALLA